MSGKAKGQVKATVIKAADPVISAPIKKSDAPSQVTVEEAVNAGDWIEPPMMLEGLKNMVTESSILPQCIRAYKNNIAGFGIGIRYTVDQEETPEMKAEFDAITEVVELLNVDQDTKQVFENIVEARETYGIAYLEVIRNLDKEVQQIEFIKDTPSVRKSRPMEPYVEIPYFHHGKETKRRKKFRKYKQEICGRTVYFKEFGDPRIMDLRDGRYVPEGAGLELRYQANEILEFAIGPQSYGEIRWIGQILGVDGSRMAEGLNNNYFYNGRHTPLMIMIRNGTLTDDSYSHLKKSKSCLRRYRSRRRIMQLDTKPLIDAINRLIEKADDDLKDSLEAEGYVAASELVKNINKLEDAIDDALDADSLEFLEKIEAATGVTDFITDIWPGIKDADDLEKALREIFRKQFDDMFREFTYQWVLVEDPVLATEVEEITKPAEAFIQGWSGELARIMNLNTKDAMERLLLKAQEKKWSIDELSEAIGNSGIREHGYRSRRVALTESLRVESYAQQESMIQNPLAYKKKWKHVMSAHPRENHMAMDGQEVFKREMFTLTGKNGATYMVLCPRDTSLPVEETANCHCLMETIADENALGMTAEERAAARKKYMDEVNAEYDAWEKKFKEDTGIEEPRDDPSVTWKIYNSYYEAYRKGEIA